ncbi:MAG: nucleoside triphosphate pyrophosphohydrolase [Desulfobacterales bacterium]|nr:nucleoside triphosphate pyrophosphohydrolase [Desulfobacterales bacterium]
MNSLEKTSPDNRLSGAIVALVALVKRLRSPGGCPWDAEQTDSTIKTYLLEEAYEVLEAIEQGSPADVCQELGDLLFQILFLAQMAAERGEFDLTELVEKITEKMIRRHPHVFGETSVNNSDDVSMNWARIKEAEKGSSMDRASALQDVPVKLPALLRAHRLCERASKIDPDRQRPGDVRDNVLDGFEKLKMTVIEQDEDLFKEEIGDLLFNLTGLTRKWGFNAEDLLRNANNKFVDRFKKMNNKTKPPLDQT